MQTKRLFIGAATISDALNIWDEVFGDAEKFEHINAHIPNKTHEYRDLIQYLETQGEHHFVFTIRENAIGQVVGCLTFDRELYGHKDCIGFFIGKPHIRQGYATEAVEAYLHYIHDNGIKQVNALCYGTNKGSRAILERMGFQGKNIGIQDYSEGNLVFLYAKKLRYSESGLNVS